MEMLQSQSFRKNARDDIGSLLFSLKSGVLNTWVNVIVRDNACIIDLTWIKADFSLPTRICKVTPRRNPFLGSLISSMTLSFESPRIVVNCWIDCREGRETRNDQSQMTNVSHHLWSVVDNEIDCIVAGEARRLQCRFDRDK
jgi:hypothetical protein